MKKTATLLTAVFLILSLAACGSENVPKNSTAPVAAAPPSSQEANADPEPQSEDMSEQTEDMSEQTEDMGEQPDSPYSMQVKITGEKTAEILFQGVNVQTDTNGTQWWAGMDDVYYVGISCYEGDAQCDLLESKKTPDGSFSLPVIGQASYEIGDGTLLLYADFSMVKDFDFNKVSEFSVGIDEDSDGQISYTKYKLSPSDVIVTELAYTPAGGAGNATSSQPQENTDSGTVGAPANQYVGVYDSSKGTLVVTADTITVTFDGTEYATDYAMEDITDQNGIGKFTYTANGTEVQVFFGTDGEIVEVYVGRDGAGFTRSAADASVGGNAPASADFAAMAGSYINDRGVAVLNIKADGSFTYTVDSSSLKDTLSGQLPTGFKSGDKVQCGDYNIVFYFSEGSTNMSTDVKDANNTSVGGDDLVKKS